MSVSPKNAVKDPTDGLLAELEAVAATDEAEVVIVKQPRRKVEAADDHVTLHGPVRAPNTAPYPVLADDQFGSADYVEAVDLISLAHKLTEGTPAFEHVKMLNVRYYWKRKGGMSAGKPVLGRCVRPSGLWKLHSDADFEIWLAADGCQGWNRGQVEALLFRQLCRIGRDTDGNTTLNAPDFVGFIAEIRQYGAWSPELGNAAKAFKQLAFEDAEA